MIRNAVFLMMMLLSLTGCLSSRTTELPGMIIENCTVPTVASKSDQVYQVSRAKTAPVIDGLLDEWRGIPAMMLNMKQQSRGRWDGPADLSGSMRLQWDTDALYFCLEVTDDIHNAPNIERVTGGNPNQRGPWENDCCQFVFDAFMNGPKGGFDLEEISFCVTDTPKGPLMAHYRLRGQPSEVLGLVKDQNVKMNLRADGIRVYEWAMPWERLTPVSPWIIGECGFSFTLNDNDGEGFAGASFWTPGILYGQDAAKFGRLVFDGAMGVRSDAVGLYPEVKLFGRNKSEWLDIKGARPFASARLLVRATKETHVRPKVAVFRPGQKTPVATGSLEAVIPGGQVFAFVWDLSSLPNGKYEIVYDVPAVRPIAEDRKAFRRLEADQLWSRRKELREKYGLDRPWDDMADAPDLVRRHRGLVAAVLEWIEPLAPVWRAQHQYNSEAQLLAIEDAVEIIEALDAGVDYLAGKRNTFWCAYYSKVDGSGQHFSLSVPEDYDPVKPYPLLIRLHGAGGGPMVDRDAVYDEPYLFAYVLARGYRSGYNGLSENDVLEVVRYVSRWYNVDPHRIYLTGGSMGGAGTWHLASRYPDLFAVAVPIAGWPGDSPLENLRHVPVFNQHGDVDWTVPVDSSRYAVSRMQQLGYAIVHREIKDAGHRIKDAWLWDQLVPGMRRIEKPETITFSCQTPEQGRAYWLHIRQILDPHLQASVKVSVARFSKEQSLTLRMVNVGVLELDTEKIPLDRTVPLLVQVGNQTMRVKTPLPQHFFVVVEDGKAKVKNAWKPSVSGIRPYRAGGAADLYTGEPLLIVYGTRGSETRNEALKRAAESLAVFGGSGRNMVMGRIPVKADVRRDKQRYDSL